ncbi:MAG: amidohydrolase family protein [Firmicutes bacterium]|nr:amidohydrolase family protein [Bacillota bacterium]
MKKVDLLILTRHMYTMEGDGVGYLADHGVAVDGGKIVAVAPNDELRGEYQAEKVIDDPKLVLMPGFIDAHMHTGHAVIRGVAQDISSWMMEGMAPFEAQRSSEAKSCGSRLAIAEAILFGTTTIGDDGADMAGAVDFVDKVGARGNISVRIREALQKSYKAGELYIYDDNYGQQTLNECLTLFDKYDGKDDGRIRIRFGPQGPDFVSKDTLLKVRQLAKERGAKIHMHLQQGSREAKQMMMRYGMRSVPWLESMGYLDEDLIGIHLTDSSQEEIQTVVKHGAGMVLCSSSIGVIDGIVPPAKWFQDAGGTVALGSDQAPGNNCHNMFNEMKLTSVLNKVRFEDSEVMPAWKVVRMATIEGAKVLGIDDKVGSIREGKDADLILIDTKHTTLTPIITTPMRNFIPNLVYSARGNEVDTVMVKGKILVENKKPITFDVDAIIEEAQGYADEIGEKAKPEFDEINGKTAQYMKEGKL